MQECYTTPRVEDFSKLVMEEFREAYTTTRFFDARGSVMSDKLFNNSWAIFYNRANLKKYEKYLINE